jgi:DNA-binding transcriptional LysR family regulator
VRQFLGADEEEKMTLNQLMAFVATAKHGNITEASKELHITQPAISRQLRLLEENSGLKLYKRVGNGIELTEDGRRFFADAQALLSQMEKIHEKWCSRSTKQTEVHSLSVGGSHGPSAILLPCVLALFKQSHLRMLLNLRTDYSRLMEQLVLKSEVEIALITALSHDPQLVIEPFRKEKIALFVSAKHPLAKNEALTLSQLAAAPLILREGKGGRGGLHKVLQQLERKGGKPNIVMRCESAEAVQTQVRLGIGFGILYQDLIEAELRDGEFKLIRVPKLDLYGDSFIVYRKDRPLSETAMDFLLLLREYRQKKRFKWPPTLSITDAA